MTDFEQLKEICRVACHERNACKPGFEALMQTESIGAILAVWRKNWDDIFASKFADVMVKNIVKVYTTAKAEFNAAEVFVNEPSERGLVIVCDAPQPIEVGGTAKAYIFAPSEVRATDNAQVYCRTAGSKITLRGHAYARIEDKGTSVDVYDFARADGAMRCDTHNAAEVVITAGTLRDYGHRRIAAYGGARIYSDATRGIELDDQSRQYPLNEYTEEV